MYIDAMEILLENKSQADIAEVAAKILQMAVSVENPGGALIIFLRGNLGAGKTTLTQEIAKQLGITETVTSPTFVIQKQYLVQSPTYKNKFNTFIHIDLYRLEGDEAYIEHELSLLKMPLAIKNPQNLVVIEWAERLHGKLRASVEVDIEQVGESERNYKIVAI